MRFASIGAAAVISLLLLVLFAIPERGEVTKASAKPGQPAPNAVVTVDPSAVQVRLPRSYFGLSTEYWTLPMFERHLLVLERVLSLLRTPGDGPLILRIGGDSADHSFWDPKVGRVPPWMFAVTPSWLSLTRSLVQSLGLRLILDLNLVTDSARTAAGWARVAESQLPRGSIAAFEIGNEPDIYNRFYWLATLAHARLTSGLLPADVSASSYIHDFGAYTAALRRVAPRVPLAGPVIANPRQDIAWISGLIRAQRRVLGIVTAHKYPYSACVDRRSRVFGTIPRVLSDAATAGVARIVRLAVRVAHRAGLPFRLDELNSVTCGGRRGVSDTFATALWAPDALFELLQAGVDGVNVHVRANAINTAFNFSGAELRAHPLLYGLLMFVRTLGPGAQLVHAGVLTDRALHLKVWAVRIQGNVLHVLLIDKGGRAAHVELRVPAAGPAEVERLLAPSLTATSGVTLAGERLGPAGTWLGRPIVEAVEPSRRGYEVTVPRFSEALVTLSLRPPAAPSPQERRRGRGHVAPTTSAPVVDAKRPAPAGRQRSQAAR